MIKLKRNMLVAVAAVVAFSGFTVGSSAALIDADSEIALFGVYLPDNANLMQATEIAFPGDEPFIAAGVNDFAFAAGGTASFNTFSLDINGPTEIFSFGGGGLFTATSADVDFMSPTAIDITMTGVWSLDGFDDTAGLLVLTLDSLGGTEFTFSGSGTVAPIPVPAAIWLMGSALLGLGLRRTR